MFTGDDRNAIRLTVTPTCVSPPHSGHVTCASSPSSGLKPFGRCSLPSNCASHSEHLTSL
jgi:hypothetical protein